MNAKRIEIGTVKTTHHATLYMSESKIETLNNCYRITLHDDTIMLIDWNGVELNNQTWGYYDTPEFPAETIVVSHEFFSDHNVDFFESMGQKILPAIPKSVI